MESAEKCTKSTLRLPRQHQKNWGGGRERGGGSTKADILCASQFEAAPYKQKIKVLLHRIHGASFHSYTSRPSHTSKCSITPSAFTKQQRNWKQKTEKEECTISFSTRAHGCSPACQPAMTWRDPWFMSNSQHYRRSFFFLLLLPVKNLAPVQKKDDTFWKAATSFLFWIYVFLYVFGYRFKEPHITVQVKPHVCS